MNDRQVPRVGRMLDAAMFHIGYTVVAAVVVVCVAELVSMLIVGVYQGSRARLSVVAPGIAPDSPKARWFSLRHRLMEDIRDASGVYRGEPWAEEFIEETSELQHRWQYRYEPFRVWGNVEVHGKYVNVDMDAFGAWRRTPTACREGQPRRSVWALGASVMVGADTPDFATIPAYLSQRLGDAQRCADVTNFGVAGYVIAQQTILLTELLKAGRRPDDVIVLAGANDAYLGAYSPGLPLTHDDLDAIRSRFEETVHLDALLRRSYTLQVIGASARRVPPLLPAAMTGPPAGDDVTVSDAELADASRRTLDHFDANIRVIQTLAREYGFRAHVFWQPILYMGRSRKTPLEQTLVEHPAFNEPDERRIFEAVYREAERRAAESRRFTYLGNVFEGVDEPVYTDGVHLGPRGNAIIAEAMARAVRTP